MEWCPKRGMRRIASTMDIVRVFNLFVCLTVRSFRLEVFLGYYRAKCSTGLWDTVIIFLLVLGLMLDPFFCPPTETHNPFLHRYPRS